MSTKMFTSTNSELQRAGDRLTEALNAVSIGGNTHTTVAGSNDLMIMAATHTGVAKTELEKLLNRIAAGARGSSPQMVAHVGLMIGYFLRDEQQKVGKSGGELHDAPPVCNAGQAELRAANHKFCPECGIVRALHREFSDGDGIDRD